MSNKLPMTASRMVRRATTPVFDVFIVDEESQAAALLARRPERLGDAVVRVSGVREPFQFLISARVLASGAPFGRISRDSVMEMARDFARQECEQRRLIGGRIIV